MFVFSGGVTMKNDILTAVTTEHNIAPIAPLPSRLSFCIGSRQPEQAYFKILIWCFDIYCCTLNHLLFYDLITSLCLSFKIK